jgi:Leucine-rich repeat (LRR) protein
VKHLTPYLIFESSTAPLTEEQVKWLNAHTKGKWKLNPQTGLVDVDGMFYCVRRNLTDFKGIRFGVVESFIVSHNELTSLEGAPQEVTQGFSCDNNRLTSLDGAPQKVGSDFSCDNNHLTSLEGSPTELRNNFYCRGNQLTSLEGASQMICGNFFCDNNQLTSLEGAPTVRPRGQFSCDGNPVQKSVLKDIYSRMRKGKNYLQAVKSLWGKIPPEDKILLDRPYFDWISAVGRKKMEAFRTYHAIKRMF